MIKLQQITSFLINLNLVAAENIDTWVENPLFIPSGKDTGKGQIILYRQTYDAVISIERWPHKRHSAELLFGQISAWLMENDPDRDEISEPRTDVDILDNDTADIQVTISFEEEIIAVPDPVGTIILKGESYRLADPEIDYAETGEVTT